MKPRPFALFLPLPLLLAIPAPQGLAAQTHQLVSSPGIPDTAAGRQLSGWLDAFNSADPQRINAFLRRETAGTEAPPPMPEEFHRITGGFRLVRIETASDQKIAAILAERSWEGAFARLTIEIDPQAAGKIKPVALRKIAAPAGVPPIARMSEAAALAALKAKLDDASRPGDPSAFSGAVRVARQGRTVFDFASGQADREKGVANTIDTKFRIGSMNKMMTAVAILQLVGAGKIRLDAPIGTYLADYPNKDVATRATIRHLLTHTGGTGDIFGPQFFEHRLSLCAHADYVALYGKRALDFTPGERFAYSNYGFLLLGAIVEAVSGQSYYDYMRDHIYRPAGMTESGSLPETVDVPKRSIGYTMAGPAGPKPLGTNADTLPCRGTSAGGGYTTMGDLIRFSEALRTGTILEKDLLAQATRAQAPGDFYGYGFIVQQVNGTRGFGHGGGAPGMVAELLILPDLGYSVAVAANMDTQLVSRIASFLGERLPAPAKAR
jgi:CubicO group peptidase (beta-lactamase class C family)